jgi:hypothetical protein
MYYKSVALGMCEENVWIATDSSDAMDASRLAQAFSTPGMAS